MSTILSKKTKILLTNTENGDIINTKRLNNRSTIKEDLWQHTKSACRSVSARNCTLR